MPIPALRTVKANIDFIGRLDKFIWQTWSAAGAKNDPGFSKGPIDFLIPPAGVPEFYDVAAGGIKLADNFVEPCPSEAVTRRQLK